jgi:hypothetical protein
MIFLQLGRIVIAINCGAFFNSDTTSGSQIAANGSGRERQ